MVRDLDAFTWRYGTVGAQMFGPCDGKLSNGGGASLSRIVPSNYGNDPNNWTANTPSPGF